ncbi:MAG: Cell division protein FtsA [Bacteroidetes bacterium ADurb.Bin397]|nr:MAG: Cell division protein FtsA [Bacteroidetes bacterium ADurb.Bin397]
MITEDIKEGCTIIRSQAELLKIKFGSALSKQMKDNEIVSIPGLRGREPKEISVKNLASIIQARMEEIIENVYYEIRNSGFEKKLIAGIVITGGGSQLKHITQLVEYITGMDTRIGYPNEHLGQGYDEVKSPMYATGVGLVIKGLQEYDKNNFGKGGDKGTTTSTPEARERKGGWFKFFVDKSKELLSDESDDPTLK